LTGLILSFFSARWSEAEEMPSTGGSPAVRAECGGDVLDTTPPQEREDDILQGCQHRGAAPVRT